MQLDQQGLDPVERLHGRGRVVDGGGQPADRDVDEHAHREGGVLIHGALAREHEHSPHGRRRCGSRSTPSSLSVTAPGATYWPITGTTSTKAPVWRARRSSAARSTEASTAGGPVVVDLDGSAPAVWRSRTRPRSPSGCTSSITWWARRIRPRRMPPICVLSNARCTSATKVPIVTSASTSATPDGERGRHVLPAPVGLPPDRGEREHRIARRRGRQREPGDDHAVAAQPGRQAGRVGGRLDLRRHEDRGEDDAGERDHPGGERAEDLLHDRQRRSAGSGRSPRPCRAAAGRSRAPPRPGWPRARAPTSPTPARRGPETCAWSLRSDSTAHMVA